MSFQEKNITVTLINFSLILGFFVIRVWQMIHSQTFTPANVFHLWGIVIGLSIVVTIIALILTHMLANTLHFIKTGERNLDDQDRTDERDQLIDLRGTKVTYSISSLGSFLAMLTFVFGHSPLVMFTLIIFFGLLAQIVSDVTRLWLYRRGF